MLLSAWLLHLPTVVMAFDTTEEAIQLANGTRYGLGEGDLLSQRVFC